MSQSASSSPSPSPTKALRRVSAARAEGSSSGSQSPTAQQHKAKQTAHAGLTRVNTMSSYHSSSSASRSPSTKPKSINIARPPAKHYKLNRNNRGGVVLEEDELRGAFEFFDTDRKGLITADDLKVKMRHLYPSMLDREYELLVQDLALDVDGIRTLLSDNELKGFDPIEAAFNSLGPDPTGHVPISKITHLMSLLGLGTLSKDDIDVVKFLCDSNEDDKMCINDFHAIMGRLYEPPPSILDRQRQQTAEQEARRNSSSNVSASPATPATPATPTASKFDSKLNSHEVRSNTAAAATTATTATTAAATAAAADDDDEVAATGTYQ